MTKPDADAMRQQAAQAGATDAIKLMEAVTRNCMEKPEKPAAVFWTRLVCAEAMFRRLLTELAAAQRMTPTLTAFRLSAADWVAMMNVPPPPERTEGRA